MSELAMYFCRQPELEIHIILYGRDPLIFYEIPLNLVIHRPQTIFNDGVRFLSTLRRLIYLRKSILLIKPDSILSFGEYWNSFVLLSNMGLNYPIFISDRCSPEKQFGTFHRFLRRALYKRVTGVIAQTLKAKIIYSQQFRNHNIQVIGNPIRMISEKQAYIEKEKIVLSVGRLIKTKHHDKLIQIFADIAENGWRLVIVGDDALKEDNRTSLEYLIRSLDMTDRIILAGNVKDVDTYYCRSQIFAFTSSSEGFPNAIGEAMSAGLPVIAFNCVAGPDELIIDGETGFLVRMFDYEAFGSKMKLLMSDDHLRHRMGDSGMKTIKNYAADIIGKKYLDFILND